MEYIVKDDNVVAVKIEGTWVPVNKLPYERNEEIENCINKLKDLGVDLSSVLSKSPVMDDKDKIKQLAGEMTKREKEMVRFLGSDPDRWVKKHELDEHLGLKGREIAGVLANLSKKAKRLELIENDEKAVELDWDSDYENIYRLNPKLKKLLDYI